ncbi:cbb3-type cytochrome oxidase assembly protein CcoS [Lysobacter sp. F60174L2]|uniref:cbb3-type cytochrome oxidase assembly protein CcoS n=1 Tax=Lysobacter sp. F60174L2 TaxID=3459295 RepID=UPI00403D8103
MNILLFLIPVSIVLMGLAIWAFVWAVRRGQFDDLDTPAIDILREDVHDRRAPTAPSSNDGDSDVDSDSDSDAAGASAGAGAGAGTGADTDAGGGAGADAAPPRNDAPPPDPRRD